MSQNWISAPQVRGDVRGDLEDPCIHVSGEHIFALTISLVKPIGDWLGLPEYKTEPMMSVISSNLIVSRVEL